MAVPNDYSVVYDLSTAGFQNWIMPAGGVVIAFIALLAVTGGAEAETPGRRTYRTVMGAIIGLFGLVFAGGTGLALYGDYASVRDAYASGGFQTAEGCVQHFRGSEKLESFDVSGHHFEYSDYVLTPGFKHMQSQGGPLSETSRVRIRYIGDDIVRLEVARTPCLPAPSFVDAN
jgi:hypothetical protein